MGSGPTEDDTGAALSRDSGRDLPGGGGGGRSLPESRSRPAVYQLNIVGELGVSSGLRRSPTRCNAFGLEMGEDLLDDARIEDDTDDPHPGATFLTDEWINLVHTLDELSPSLP